MIPAAVTERSNARRRSQSHAQRRVLPVVARVAQRGYQIATLGQRLGRLLWPSSLPAVPWLGKIKPLTRGLNGAWITAVMLKGPVGTLLAGLVMLRVIGVVKRYQCRFSLTCSAWYRDLAPTDFCRINRAAN